MSDLPVGTAVGAWQVTRCDGGGVTLEAARAIAARDTGKKAVTVLGSTALAFLLLLDGRVSGWEAVTWPLAALLFVVALLGMAALARSLRRWVEGVRLSFDAGAGTIGGAPLAEGKLTDYLARPHLGPLDEVEAVVLATFRDKAGVRVALELRLQGGRRLEGPELEGVEAALEDLKAALRPAGAVMAARRGLSLVET